MSADTNLLEETEEAIHAAGYETGDVQFIVGATGWCSWTDFASRARDYNYYAGYGAAEVDESLRIRLVSKNGRCGWLERFEYDGSERWVYKEEPKIEGRYNPLLRLGADVYPTPKPKPKVAENAGAQFVNALKAEPEVAENAGAQFVNALKAAVESKAEREGLDLDSGPDTFVVSMGIDYVNPGGEK